MDIVKFVCVIKDQRNNLLSKAELYNLWNYWHHHPGIYSTEDQQSFRVELPKVFKGLGRLREEHKISIRSGSTSTCLYTPRTVHHPIRNKVKEQLEWMVSQEVMSPVTVPTERCSGMVCPMKTDRHVRICVALTALNQAVRREIHPMARVDDNLANCKEVRCFRARCQFLILANTSKGKFTDSHNIRNTFWTA